VSMEKRQSRGITYKNGVRSRERRLQFLAVARELLTHGLEVLNEARQGENVLMKPISKETRAFVVVGGLSGLRLGRRHSGRRKEK
jgi:hypothetical protein